MKLLSLARILFVFTALFGSVSHADTLRYSAQGPSVTEANATLERVGEFLMSMKGINSIGIVACDELTGIPSYQLPRSETYQHTYVYCIDVGTETVEAANALEILFPLGSKFKNTFVHVGYAGRISGI